MTEREPDNSPRRTADVIRQLLEHMQADASAEAEAEADGPVAFYVLELRGVPQGISGPYRAKPEADPEAELGHEYDGRELQPGTPEYEAEYAAYQAWASQPGPEPEAEPDVSADIADAELEAGPEIEPEAEP